MQNGSKPSFNKGFVLSVRQQVHCARGRRARGGSASHVARLRLRARASAHATRARMGVAHTRTRAHAAHAAHAAQDTTLARAAAAVNDIQFSVSVRGIHWLTANDVIAHELGEQRACKVRMHALAYTRTHAQVRSSSVSPRARAHTRVCVCVYIYIYIYIYRCTASK